MKIDIRSSGNKNAHVTVSGIIHRIDGGPQPIVHLFMLRDIEAKTLRIESALFAFPGKSGALLTWEGEDLDDDDRIIFPVEGRGYLNWEAGQCPLSPPGATNIALQPYNIEFDSAFRLHLDMGKS